MFPSTTLSPVLFLSSHFQACVPDSPTAFFLSLPSPLSSSSSATVFVPLLLPTLLLQHPHSPTFPLLPSSYFPVLPSTLLSFTPSPLTISCSLPLLRLWVLKQQKSVGEPLITAALTTIEGDVWRDETRVPENLGWPARIPPAARLAFPFLLCLCE